MEIKKIVKIVGLNAGIALVDTILFSPGLMGIQLAGGSILETALFVTAIVMSIVVFSAGNFMLLLKKEKRIQNSEIKTSEDYIIALKQNYDKKTFESDIETILEQIKRFHRKTETIEDILLQKFESTEISYSKFHGTIIDIENIFYINIKSILNKLNAFDETDYKHTMEDNIHKKFSEEFLQSKMSVFNEYIYFINGATEDNEQILLKLDKLLLEISRFNSLEDGEIENMSAMKEIDELINKTKFYK
jgi:hypothetical protein